MVKKKVSIKDIAREVGVSTTTISFIINGKDKENSISKSLVKKVHEKIKELGYQPNHFAKNLRSGKTKIIGLMVEDISNSFFANIAKEIEDLAYKSGYRIVYCSTDNDTKKAKEFLSMFKTMGTDGCIIAPTMGIEDDIKDLIDGGVKVVLFDRAFKNKNVDTVLVDDEGGIYDGVQHLIKNGYKNIGLVATAFGDPEKEGRIIGYNDAMKENGLESRVFPLNFTSDRKTYVTIIKDILKENPDFDALVFSTNYLAVCGIEAISNLDISIPGKIAVLAFDENDFFRIHKPSITSIAQPRKAIAQKTINLLLSRLQNEEKGITTNITLATELIVRDSSPSVKKK
ncbi:MAG: LacI family DNA-binding transcriptional regulator [Bacteroidales bacterium]